MKLFKRSRQPKGLIKQCGLTLIELGLAIAISAAIIIVLLIALRSVDNAKNVMQATNVVTQVWSAGRRYGSTYGSIKTLVTDGYLENKTVKTNPWGGTYTSTGTSKDSSGIAQLITVSVTGIDSAVCNQLKAKWLDKSNLNTTLSACGNGAKAFTITFNNNIIKNG